MSPWKRDHYKRLGPLYRFSDLPPKPSDYPRSTFIDHRSIRTNNKNKNPTLKSHGVRLPFPFRFHLLMSTADVGLTFSRPTGSVRLWEINLISLRSNDKTDVRTFFVFCWLNPVSLLKMIVINFVVWSVCYFPLVCVLLYSVVLILGRLGFLLSLCVSEVYDIGNVSKTFCRYGWSPLFSVRTF